MEKFNSKKHLKYFPDLPFSYFYLPIHLDCLGYVLERNGKSVLLGQDIYNAHEFPSFFLPPDKINWEGCSMVFVTEEDIRKVEEEGVEIEIKNPTGTEFFFKTDDFISPTKKIRERINQFNRLYDYKILNEYSKEKIEGFYRRWKAQKERNGDTFDEAENFFFFCLNNLRKYPVKQVYVEVGGELIGLSWGIKFSEQEWVGLHLKALYDYKGLSRVLHQERAKLFSDCSIFSLGTGAKEEGIARYKKELGPCSKKDYFYILTGKKISRNSN